MPKKLSLEIVESRLAPRGIRLVGNFNNVQAKTEFECDKGHRWESKPNNVMSGSGCPECRKISKEEINHRLAPRGITIIGNLIDTRHKSTFQCSNGHIWESNVNNILNGNECPECSRSKQMLTPSEINDRIKDRGISMIGEYVLSSLKTDFTCVVCNHIWQATPNNVMGGSGCPCCADYGFNDAAESTVYLLEYVGFIKVGITNDFDRRYTELAKGAKLQPINVFRHDVATGKIARDIERIIKNKFTGGYKTSDEYPNGHTETFSKEIMAELLEIIEEELNVIH